MMFNNRFFTALNIRNNTELQDFSKKTKIPVKKLKMYNEESILPFEDDLQIILTETGLNEIQLKLQIGIIDKDLTDLLIKNAAEIGKVIKNPEGNSDKRIHKQIKPIYTTNRGELYQDDCISVMNQLPSNSIDLIFADPPFNLNKVYESNINDKLTKMEYLEWTEEWVTSCVRLLKEGGSLFVWNLPIWNTYISSILNKYLNFRHWIAVDIKYQLPIRNKFYPAHYSLLYYSKGKKPATFNGERIPLECCRHCGGDIKDYGGYKDKLNKNGLNLSDVWSDISPVRHSKYKSREGNELPLKLLERIISIGSNEGDTVFDPFGGSGTTYIVSEILNRNWIGSEIGPVDTIINRFQDISSQKQQIDAIQKKKNVLFTDEIYKARLANGHWIPETLLTKK